LLVKFKVTLIVIEQMRKRDSKLNKTQNPTQKLT